MEKITNSLLIKKALDVAVEKGMTEYQLKTIPRRGVYNLKHYMTVWVDSENVMTPPEVIILSHGFAEAFFGKEGFTKVQIDGQKLVNWQYHLQQMVICENRADYLRQFLVD